ncbi:hypothetical protein BIZ38_08330 [Pseudoalteromonas sp. BZK2]|uniref:hypothetical protein n=1 Tax=unclassified Pseudoalteromonas TaxID=194690 RepID=UPI00110B736B|nr:MULTISPECIES: hypothetical protein [unclassified Pseudoalteromonas]MBC7008474.1 hypothetical protein [Pseudoalteromonas sp. BZK2]TMP20437.1 hypothetical protein CWC02_06215 [Pseudoalteromonas sp. S2721]|tara:strand:+ start:2336 stop:2839 length:504 start_codon:yes stop_codon:yes gene_type:complete
MKTNLYLILFFLMLFNSSFLMASESADPFEKIAAAELDYQYETLKSETENLSINVSLKRELLLHQKKLMTVTEEAYELQYWMTIGIFIIVTLLVLGGFYLSYLQFKLKTQQPESSSNATFKIGKTGIEFSSSVIGLMILFMSFLFFYLYVNDVYKIQVQATPIVSEH